MDDWDRHAEVVCWRSKVHIYFPRGRFPRGQQPDNALIVVGLRVPFRGWFSAAVLSGSIEVLLLALTYYSRKRVFDAHAKEWVAASLFALAAIPATYLTAARSRLHPSTSELLFLARWGLAVTAGAGLAFAWALLLQRPYESPLYPILTVVSLIPLSIFILYMSSLTLAWLVRGLVILGKAGWERLVSRVIGETAQDAHRRDR